MYDPNCEATNEQTIIAAHWECLRRNGEFRSLCDRWLKSEQFRNSFVLTPAYYNLKHHTPRCALDWMLRTAERVLLAQVQIVSMKWMVDSRFNFGPMVCHENFSPAALTRKNWQEFFSVEPMANPPPPLRVTQSWDCTPAPFQEQFRIAYGLANDFSEIGSRLQRHSEILRVAAQKLAAGDPLNETAIIADFLFRSGSELRDLREFSKVFAIPKRRYSEKQFNQLLRQIRDNFTASIPLLPTKTYDSHESYLGTAEDWRWFLDAEGMGLDVRKTVDLRKLSERYSEDLRHRAIRGKAPRRAKPHGFTGSKIPAKAIKNRRRTVKRHVLAIESWIHRTYPPQPFDADPQAL